MAKKPKVEKIDGFEIGKCETNKQIEAEIKKFNTVLDGLPEPQGAHIRPKVQAWLDQYDSKNAVEINSAALHKAAAQFNHLTNNLNVE